MSSYHNTNASYCCNQENYTCVPTSQQHSADQPVPRAEDATSTLQACFAVMRESTNKDHRLLPTVDLSQTNDTPPPLAVASAPCSFSIPPQPSCAKGWKDRCAREGAASCVGNDGRGAGFNAALAWSHTSAARTRIRRKPQHHAGSARRGEDHSETMSVPHLGLRGEGRSSGQERSSSLARCLGAGCWVLRSTAPTTSKTRHGKNIHHKTHVMPCLS